MRLPRRERYASRLNREKEERNPLGQRNREKGGCARFFKFGSKGYFLNIGIDIGATPVCAILNNEMNFNSGKNMLRYYDIKFKN